MKCYEHYKVIKNKCQKKSCRYWINCAKDNNCALITAEKSEKMTLEDVGNLFNVTRMRICQIEKLAIKKLKEKVKDVI
jgi:DNA-directed RNA polymerase specialized sigma subunit